LSSGRTGGGTLILANPHRNDLDARLEEDACPPIEERFAAIPTAEQILTTSRISRLECRCKPLREGKQDILAIDDRFFGASELRLEEISAAVIEEATEVRALVDLRTPDSVHAATARLLRVQSFWTTDMRFLRCPHLPVERFPAV
jgi:uncharacterized protein